MKKENKSLFLLFGILIISLAVLFSYVSAQPANIQDSKQGFLASLSDFNPITIILRFFIRF